MSVLIPTTWSPSDKDATITLSNGNKTAVANGGSVRSIFGASSGKYYWEYTISSGSGQMVGIATSAAATGTWPGSDLYGWAYEKASGSVYRNGAVIQTVAANGTNIGILLDATNKKLRFRRNGTLVGSEITLTGSVWHAIFGYGNTCVGNFGASAFAYAVPAEYAPGLGPVGYELSGNVKDSADANAARVVRAYRLDTGELAGSAVSDAGTGNYTIATEYDGEHDLVFEPASGESLNSLILRGVVPL